MNSRRFNYSSRAYKSFINKVVKYGTPASPRGEPTLELLNSTVTLKCPLDRLVSDRGRRMNIGFAFAEWYSIMFGIDNIEFFERFIEGYAKYSSDGLRLDGAYGPRIFTPSADQLDAAWQKLLIDPCSRQAVVSIYDSDDLLRNAGGKNTPCTLTLQFLNRDNRLHLIVNMRSSDVWKGMTYDVFVFTMIQEWMARRLQLRVGEYVHNAASLHFYLSDIDAKDQLTGKRWPRKMKPMPQLITRKQINRLFEVVKAGQGLDLPLHEWILQLERHLTQTGQEDINQYLRDVANTMKAFADRYRNRAAAAWAYNQISDKAVKYVLRPWLVRAKAFRP